MPDTEHVTSAEQPPASERRLKALEEAAETPDSARQFIAESSQEASDHVRAFADRFPDLAPEAQASRERAEARFRELRRDEEIEMRKIDAEWRAIADRGVSINDEAASALETPQSKPVEAVSVRKMIKIEGAGEKKEIELAHKELSEISELSDALFKANDLKGLEALLESFSRGVSQREDKLQEWEAKNLDKESLTEITKLGYDLSKLRHENGLLIYTRAIAQAEVLKARHAVEAARTTVKKEEDTLTKIELPEYKAKQQKKIDELKLQVDKELAAVASAEKQIDVYDQKIYVNVTKMRELKARYDAAERVKSAEQAGEGVEGDVEIDVTAAPERSQSHKPGRAEVEPSRLAETLKKGEKIFDAMAAILSNEGDPSKLLDFVGRKFMQFTEYGAEQDKHLRADTRGARSQGSEVTSTVPESEWEEEIDRALKKKFKLEREAAVLLRKISQGSDPAAKALAEEFTAWRKTQDTETKWYRSGLEDWNRKLKLALDQDKTPPPAEEPKPVEEKKAA